MNDFEPPAIFYVVTHVLVFFVGFVVSAIYSRRSQ